MKTALFSVSYAGLWGQAALSLEDEFVQDALHYSIDPGVLASHRRALIEALAEARPYLP